MEQRFETLDEVRDYIEFLEMKGREVPQWVLDERQRLEQESQITADEFIFSTMKAHNKFMSPEKEQVVREMTDQLLMEGEEAKQPCLLLGKVQCGKTDTFESIIGLCFDKGIDIAVVMTKGTRTLTNQTLQRLEHDFRFFKDNKTYGQKVIITIYDILDLYKRGGLTDYQKGNPANKFIIVAKKEQTNLDYLNKLFEEDEVMRNKKVLICDDEADFASRNYYARKGETGLCAIADLIESFIKLPHYCRYLQVTATPYSLYLQPDGTIQLREGKEASPWLPRYTGLVPIHDKYIGGKQYFEDSEREDSMYHCMYQYVSEDCMGILSARNEWYLESKAHSENLDPLNYAIVSYMFAAAVRSIQVRRKSNKKYFSSCLIHCEVAKKNHQWQEDLIIGIIDDIKNAFLAKGNADLHILDLEQDAYDSLKLSNSLGYAEGLINEKFPSFAEVESEVKRILEYNDYVVKVVNSEVPGMVATMLNEKGQLRLDNALNFFIGGSILDRGITIDNMLCFFYGRDPKKFQMDTVLQHARMYGARDKEDMACTRFFTTEAIYDVLKTINNIDSMMYKYLKAHRDTVRTDDFTSMVIGYDKRINASAPNKYTIANTKVIKGRQRILPVGFQTGDLEEMAEAKKKIDELILSCPDYGKNTKDKPFFLMPYEVAAEIIRIISSTLKYGPEYENVNYTWDDNEMLTALDHCTFGTDGMIYCLLRTGRNMSREREQSKVTKTRWIDAPDDGNNDTKPSRDKAQDRPVLMLLGQNGGVAEGWRGAPFYWPVFVVQQNIHEGIFTINANKQKRAPRRQFKLDSLNNYPKEEILVLPVRSENLFDILLGLKNTEDREIKRTTCSLYLEKDLLGDLILVEGTDPNAYYDLSSYNDGVFPFEIRQYKYLYLKNSQDFSGSQVFVSLNGTAPYELWADRFTQKDVVYSSSNVGKEAEDDTACLWHITFNIDRILEQKLTPQDEENILAYRSEVMDGSQNF